MLHKPAAAIEFTGFADNSAIRLGSIRAETRIQLRQA
jgi:hypothetical protein